MISEKVKALLSLTGTKQSDLAGHMGIAAQSVANKMNRDSWSGKDLAKVAEFVGGQLAFILPNGQQIFIDCSEEDQNDSQD